MSGFRNRLANFMIGRYGVDEFGRALNIVNIIILLIMIIVTRFWPPINYLWFVAVALMVYQYFRMFSRNHARRAAENAWFCRVFKRNNNRTYGNYTHEMSNRQKKALDKRTHCIFKCPNCRQKIRVPRHKGRISIKCPQCRIEFIKKT